MPRKTKNLYSLNRGRVRASWNKYNLFNLYKKSDVFFQGKNLYQQKWTAKQETRAYHGEYLTEGRWKATFSQDLESVAHLDRSLRGETRHTPIPLQTYAVLERRLDFALFRAMFASSARQARQFILSGDVWVNDIKIKQPGYELKPGDIFHVNPDKVLTALGATKPSVKEALKIDNVQILRWNKYVKRAKENPREVWLQDYEKQKSKESRTSKLEKENSRKDKLESESQADNEMLAKQNAETKEKVLADALTLGLKQEDPSSETFATIYKDQTAEKALDLFKAFISFKNYTSEDLKTKTSEELSGLIEQYFKESIDQKNSESDKKHHSDVRQKLAALRNAHLEDIRIEYKIKKESGDVPSEKDDGYDPKWIKSLKSHEKLDSEKVLEDPKSAKVDLPWQKGLYGLNKPNKPYFTPWKVRPFLAPFAILPSHIEISFETCHAVYMRDPVALPGKSEVISPFGLPVHERAYMFYVERTRKRPQEK